MKKDKKKKSLNEKFLIVLYVLLGLEVLFLSPHYDDMVYSCALTIAKLLNQGCHITNVNFF